MKILAIDDDDSVLKAIQRILEDADHEVETSESAAEGANRVTSGEYDVVLVDY